MVYIDRTLFKIQISRGQAAEFRNPKSCFQQDNHLVIILGIDGIILYEFQEFFFLCGGQRNLWLGIVVDYFIDLEVKGIFAEAIILNIICIKSASIDCFI